MGVCGCVCVGGYGWVCLCGWLWVGVSVWGVGDILLLVYCPYLLSPQHALPLPAFLMFAPDLINKFRLYSQSGRTTPRLTATPPAPRHHLYSSGGCL